MVADPTTDPPPTKKGARRRAALARLRPVVTRWRLTGYILLASAIGYIVARDAWLSDDAYISFRTADNFLHGYGLRWNIAERVQSYTNPLWLFLVIPLYAVGGNVGLSALALSGACLFAHLGLLARYIARRPLGLVLAASVLLSSKAFVDYSTSGLENPLTFVFIALFYVVYAYREGASDPPLAPLSFIVGLSILNRMDTVLLFAPAMLDALITRGWSRRNLLHASAGLLIVGGWLIFSLVYYGFPFPNTAYAKLGSGIDRLEVAAKGLAYLRQSWKVDPISLTTIAVVGSMGAVFGKRRTRALSLGLFLYLAYVVRIGGDFMSGRFIAAPLFGAVCVLAHL
ncbi:MAG: hypothetical protein AAGA56_27100, partial [Myxococcota bacterium]